MATFADVIIYISNVSYNEKSKQNYLVIEPSLEENESKSAYNVAFKSCAQTSINSMLKRKYLIQYWMSSSQICPQLQNDTVATY